MRILQINKNYYVRGGADQIFFDSITGLQARGHEVSVFSTHNEKNLSNAYEKYFVPGVPSLKKQEWISEKLAIIRRMFHSSLVEARLSALILDTKPEVAHIHNAYRELSASTFLTLKKLGVPTVMTVHDMFPLCPNHSFMLGDGLAEEKLNKPYKCLLHRCINNSFQQSLAGVAEAYYYRYKKIWQHIDRFICPSEFIQRKLIEYGFPAEKMRVVYNAVKTPASIPPLGTKVVFLGRLHVEKGIRIFMAAAKELPEASIIVAGSGPEEAWVKKYIIDNNLKNVELRGFVSGTEWEKTMAEAKVVVVPAIFYENCSAAILEALSLKRLVVASNRGGNPELIIDGQSGFLAEPENPDDVAQAIKKALALKGSGVEAMQGAGNDILKKHTMEGYISALEKVYQEVKK